MEIQCKTNFEIPHEQKILIQINEQEYYESMTICREVLDKQLETFHTTNRSVHESNCISGQPKSVKNCEKK